MRRISGLRWARTEGPHHSGPAKAGLRSRQGPPSVALDFNPGLVLQAGHTSPAPQKSHFRLRATPSGPCHFHFSCRIQWIPLLKLSAPGAKLSFREPNPLDSGFKSTESKIRPAGFEFGISRFQTGIHWIPVPNTKLRESKSKLQDPNPLGSSFEMGAPSFETGDSEPGQKHSGFEQKAAEDGSSGFRFQSEERRCRPGCGKPSIEPRTASC